MRLRLLARPLPAAVFGRPPRRRVGLLGGSFNPAHAGHRQVSELALKYLGLDEIWWLVSPQNPLKPSAGMGQLNARIASAKRFTHGDPRMRATALETALATRFTADTLAVLRARFPRIRFVWLMGADNLRQIPRWQRWSSIFHAIPIAVFARPTYDSNALAGKAAIRFKQARRSLRQANRLSAYPPPAWAFLHSRLHPASGTLIRAGKGQPGW